MYCYHKLAYKNIDRFYVNPVRNTEVKIYDTYHTMNIHIARDIIVVNSYLSMPAVCSQIAIPTNNNGAGRSPFSNRFLPFTACRKFYSIINLT